MRSAALLLCTCACASVAARECGMEEIQAKNLKGCVSLKWQKYLGPGGALWIADQLHHNVHLKSLDLHHTKCTDEDAIAIAGGLINNTHLKRLHLFNNRIRNNGSIALGNALKHNHVLEYLDLGSNGVRDEGAKGLAEGLRHNTGLRKLNLYFNLVGEEGAKALASALKVNRAMRMLHLDNNDIEEEGGLALAEAVQGVKGGLVSSAVAPSPLGELGLMYNPLSNKAMDALMDAAITNPTIHSLKLDHVPGCNGETERRLKEEHRPRMHQRHAIAKLLVHHDLIEGAGHHRDHEIGNEKRWHGGWHASSGPPLASPYAAVIDQLKAHESHGLRAIFHMSEQQLRDHAALAALEPHKREQLISALMSRAKAAMEKDEI